MQDNTFEEVQYETLYHTLLAFVLWVTCMLMSLSASAKYCDVLWSTTANASSVSFDYSQMLLRRKNMQRCFATVLVILLLACTALQAGAETLYVFNDHYADEYNDLYEYTLNADGEAGIHKYLGSVEVLRIPAYVDRKKVIAIGAEAYAEFRGLECVDIPNSVITIGEGAFRNCIDLAYVGIPVSVTSIAADAFEGCDKATYLVQQNSFAEQYCKEKGLKYLYGGVDGDGAYENLSDGEVQQLNSYYNRPHGELDHMVVSAIAPFAFEGCNHQSITLGAKVKHIGDGAFLNSKELQCVCIQIGTQSIGSEAFKGCDQLRTISIPDSVTSIGINAFVGCNENLVVSVLPGSYAEEYCKQYGIGYDYQYGFDTGAHSYWENGRRETAWQRMDDYFGKGGDVVIPNAMGGIEIEIIGDYSFAGRTDLTSVVIPDGVTTIMMEAFSHCTALERVVLPHGLSYIGIAAFIECDSLKHIEIPGTVIEVAGSAFWGCSALETVVIPESVANLSHTFENCPALKTIYVKRNSYAERYCADNNLPYAYYGEHPVGNTCRIDADSARVRIGAGTEHEVVGTVLRGERYEVLGLLPASNGRLWYQIMLDGKLCWISSGVCSVE